MKKFLLVIAVSMFAFAMNAQTISYKKTKVLQEQKAEKFQTLPSKQVNGMSVVKAKKDRPGVQMSGQLKSFNDEVCDVKKMSVSKRRVGELAPSYDGSAINYSTKENVEWTMQVGTLTSGEACFADVIPSPFSSDGLVATYTNDGGKITIPAQKVAQTSYTDKDGNKQPLYCYLINPLTSSVDGSIHMTLAEDGSLTSDEGYIAYYFFMTDEYKFKNEDGSSNVYTSKIYRNVVYTLAGAAPVTMFDIDNGILYAGQTIAGNYWLTNYAIAGADAPISLANTSSGKATAWAWSVTEEETPLTADTYDFVFTAGHEKTYSDFKLVGINGDNFTDYTYGYGRALNSQNDSMYTDFAVLSAGSESYFVASSTGTHAIMTRFNPDGDLAYYTNFSTPDKAGEGNSFHKMISYQGKPCAPLYITGITLPVILRSYEDNFTLDVKLYKAAYDEQGGRELGELIASSTATKDNIDARFAETSGLTAITFPLSIEDEYGMTQDVDYLFIDDEFYVVIEGWDNGTFSASLGSQSITDNQKPTTWFTLTDDPEESWYSWTGWNTALFIGLEGATYGYLYTNDATDVKLAVEGGEAKIHVEPMFYSTDDEGNKVTRLFLDENIEGNEIPEWLSVAIADEVYTDEEQSFNLVFSAEALPEGVEGRQADLVFFQEGAQLKVTVTQGTVTGIAATKVEVKSNNSQMFNLAGQRVNKGYKGLVIKNGRKMLNK